MTKEEIKRMEEITKKLSTLEKQFDKLREEESKLKTKLAEECHKEFLTKTHSVIVSKEELEDVVCGYDNELGTFPTVGEYFDCHESDECIRIEIKIIPLTKQEKKDLQIYMADDEYSVKKAEPEYWND